MWELILGHVLGDYFIQTHWMASNKTNPGIDGTMACFIHCLTYTFCVFACLLFLIPNAFMIYVIVVGIFLSHWFIDRYGLAYRYMKWKGGPDLSNPFAPIIYVVLDNSTHIVLMYGFLVYVCGIKL
jgi:hypothetical protein